MKHIGIFSPPAPGHVNPMSCLGRELQYRGHRVTYFQLRDNEEAIRRTGLDFAPIAERIIVGIAPGPVVADPAILNFRYVRADVRRRPRAA